MMMSDKSTASKNGKKTRGRPFEPGHPGGPGRPAGSRNKATLLLDEMADGAAPAVLKAVTDAAKNGDLRAAEILFSRIWPVRKGRPVAIDLPAINSAGDIVSAIGRVADAVGAGELTPDEGQAISAVLETKRKAIETVELEARITALEQERK